LWVSQSARVLSDWCLRLFLIQEIAALGEKERNSAAHLVTAVFIAPFILLAPANGALSNAFRKRRVLIGSAALCVIAAALLAVSRDIHWGLAFLNFGAIGMAVYSPTRYALLPAAAEDTRLPLPRVLGWIEMGGAVGIVGGAMLGIALWHVPWFGDPFPAPVAVALSASVIGFLTALPVRFLADVWRPEPPLDALAGFFRDAGRVFRRPEARGSLLGLALFLGLVTAGSGALISSTFDPHFLPGKIALLLAMGMTAIGAAIGSALAGLQGNLRRCLGLVPFAATGLLVALVWAMIDLARASIDTKPTWPCLLLGLMTGLANVPLRSFYQAAVPADARGNGMAVMNTTIFLANTLLAGGMFLLSRTGIVGPSLAQLRLLATLTAAGTLMTWWLLTPMVRELLFPSRKKVRSEAS
jgi:MFS family permease